MLSLNSVTPILLPVTVVNKVSAFNKLVFNNISNATLRYHFSDRLSGE